jgi:hypothetical protein
MLPHEIREMARYGSINEKLLAEQVAQIAEIKQTLEVQPPITIALEPVTAALERFSGLVKTISDFTSYMEREHLLR